MALDTVKPLRPAPLDVISTEEAAEVISAAEARLAALESKRSQAEAAAASAERRARDEPVDPALHAWAVVQLERLKGQLRAEHEVEMQALLASAEARARDCVARAHREADVIITYARAIDSVRAGEQRPVVPSGPAPRDDGGGSGLSAGTPAVASPPPIWTAADPAPRTPTPTSSPFPPPAPPLPRPVPAPDASSPAPIVGVAVPVHEPGSLADRGQPPVPTQLVDTEAVAAVAAPPAVPAPPRSDAAPAAAPGAAEPVAWVAEPPPPGGGSDGPPGGRRPDDGEFWPAEDPSKVRSFFHRIPRLAILQVGAVIVILIVVLLRIG